MDQNSVHKKKIYRHLPKLIYAMGAAGSLMATYGFIYGCTVMPDSKPPEIPSLLKREIFLLNSLSREMNLEDITDELISEKKQIQRDLTDLKSSDEYIEQSGNYLAAKTEYDAIVRHYVIVSNVAISGGFAGLFFGISSLLFYMHKATSRDSSTSQKPQ